MGHSKANTHALESLGTVQNMMDNTDECAILVYNGIFHGIFKVSSAELRFQGKIKVLVPSFCYLSILCLSLVLCAT